jgi:hypothetical protein
VAETDPNGLRYERKFVPERLGIPEVEALIRLHPAGFREIHHARWVNNIYFDTPSFDHYEANVRGVARRVKCRIRWYGELLGPVGRPTLELKRKQGIVGSKQGYPLQPFEQAEGFDARALLEKSDLPAALRPELAALRPILTNRYLRRYFLSSDGGYRVTLDSELGFWPIGPAAGSFRGLSTGDARVILELKFGIGGEAGGARIASQLPFRVTRSSKYVIGIDLLYGR